MTGCSFGILFPVLNGEKMSAFLAIATAKEVLMKQDPSLLEEFGGKVSLNMDWAKAFMRRHALKNPSQGEINQTTP